MRKMQEHVMAALEAAIEEAGLHPVQKSQWANRGRVYGMKALTAVFYITYDFQDNYCSVRLFPAAIEPTTNNHTAGRHHCSYSRLAEMVDEITEAAVSLADFQEA